MLGGDPTNISATDRQLLLNKNAIAINKDQLGVQARKLTVAERAAAVDHVLHHEMQGQQQQQQEQEQQQSSGTSTSSMATQISSGDYASTNPCPPSPSQSSSIIGPTTNTTINPTVDYTTDHVAAAAPRGGRGASVASVASGAFAPAIQWNRSGTPPGSLSIHSSARDVGSGSMGSMGSMGTPTSAEAHATNASALILNLGQLLCLTLTSDLVSSSNRPRLEWRPCNTEVTHRDGAGSGGADSVNQLTTIHPNRTAQIFANHTARISKSTGTPAPESEYSDIVHVSSGQCVEIAWAVEHSDADVEVNPCGEGKSENWHMHSSGAIVSGTNVSNCLGLKNAGAPTPPPAPVIPTPSPPHGPTPPTPTPQGDVWAGPLAGCHFACLLVNKEPVGPNSDSEPNSALSITCPFSALGIDPGTEVDVEDVFSGQTLGTHKGGFSAQVQSHDCR